MAKKPEDKKTSKAKDAEKEEPAEVEQVEQEEPEAKPEEPAAEVKAGKIRIKGEGTLSLMVGGEVYSLERGKEIEVSAAVLTSIKEHGEEIEEA